MSSAPDISEEEYHRLWEENMRKQYMIGDFLLSLPHDHDDRKPKVKYYPRKKKPSLTARLQEIWLAIFNRTNSGKSNV